MKIIGFISVAEVQTILSLNKSCNAGTEIVLLPEKGYNGGD